MCINGLRSVIVRCVSAVVITRHAHARLCNKCVVCVQFTCTLKCAIYTVQTMPRDGASALAERHDYLILISYLHMRTSRIMYEYANSHSVRAVSVGACVRVCLCASKADVLLGMRARDKARTRTRANNNASTACDYYALCGVRCLMLDACDGVRRINIFIVSPPAHSMSALVIVAAHHKVAQMAWTSARAPLVKGIS